MGDLGVPDEKRVGDVVLQLTVEKVELTLNFGDPPGRLVAFDLRFWLDQLPMFYDEIVHAGQIKQRFSGLTVSV